MKLLMWSLVFLNIFFSNSIFSQNQQDIEIIQKKEGESIIVSFKNNSTEQKEINLHIDGKGTCQIEKSPIIKLVKVGEEVTFITLTPLKGKKLDYNISYVPKSKPTEEEIKIYEIKLQKLTVDKITDYSKGIIVFGQEGCSRSNKTAKYLINNKIEFRYVNLTKSENLNEFMLDKLKEKSIDGRIKLPVIVNKGKLNYNLDDLDDFLKKLSN